VPNPALNAVPLIVILAITALKDAVEDWRRTNLDAELNNAPVHRLIDWNNVNVANEQVSIWRRFKKATSRGIEFIWGKMKRSKKNEGGKSYAERATDKTRPSIDTRRGSVVSEQTFHTSAEDRNAIQMTPVPSPQPDHQNSVEGKEPFPDMEPTKSKSRGPPQRYSGSVLNPDKETSGTARFHHDAWKNVKVGDFVRLYDNEEIPADVVVLSSADPDGVCYIETKNLDGETNLKLRNAMLSTRKVRHARDCEKAEFWIESEGPQTNLYGYTAVMKWHDREAKREMAEAIGINNLLPRGSSIRNTEWVLGVVVFTGSETKIMLNSGITPSKRAYISRDLNWNVIYNFIILFFMCLVAAVVQGTAWGEPNTSHTWFEFGSYGNDHPGLDGFITFWAALILFQNLVPISLYITLEIIRTLQAVFIYSDVLMYYEKLDYPCTPKTWNISDDLGQIEYIFSDKTGTLTQNVMEFKKCTINGVPYGEAYTEALAGMQRRQGIDVDVEGEKARKQIAADKELMLEKLDKQYENPYRFNEEVSFVAPDFVADLANAENPAQAAANKHFMMALALCHSVVPAIETVDGRSRIEYKAQSPDESALVGTARDVGFSMLRKIDDKFVLDVLGKEETYTVLDMIEFNSTRKRMSVIVRMPDNKIILFCKGADSIIYGRLRKGEQRELRQTTAEHLEMFAREGLRTLCIAHKHLTEEEYQQWALEYAEASQAVVDREEKQELIAEKIEQELMLLGGTAIEDRLQDGVPDAIALLGQAGIKLWVLTGDKVETAINIGFSCNLLNNDMDLIVFDIKDESLATAEAQLDKNLSIFGMTGSDEELKRAQKEHAPPPPTHALVIDGESLKLCLDDSLRQKFLLLCKQCRAVLCCRVSPAQKASVVEMVKNGLDCLTLSIGDGANDVAMIQKAHVGVGIAGEEGRQAVMSSDYAIAQFRFLTRLILVHGRWSYRRLAETIANFFYKNLVWTFALFWYQIYTNFDCTYIYDYTYIVLYNLAFTSLPVILLGVFDQDVGDKVSLAVPQLYTRGIERLEWTRTKFWLYMVDGIYQSAIVFFMAYLCFAPGNFLPDNGLNIDDYGRMGVFVATAAVIIVNLYVLMNVYRWDWLTLLIVFISIMLIWFWTGIYTAFTAAYTFYGAAPQVYGALSFWAFLLLTVILCLLPRFISKALQKIYFPYDVDIVREQVQAGKFDYLKDNNTLMPPQPDKVKSLTSDEEETPGEFRIQCNLLTTNMANILV
jgi:phospholipid-translocating ATPase